MNLADVKRFVAKAGCAHSQRTARRLWGRVALAFRALNLEGRILTAWDHALGYEGRAELDEVGAEAIRRLTRGSCPKCGTIHSFPKRGDPPAEAAHRCGKLFGDVCAHEAKRHRHRRSVRNT